MTTFERIKSLADGQGISLKDLAIRLGFSENNIYKWKTAKPKGEDLAKVADYFNVTVDYLLGRADAPKEMLQKPKVQILARKMDTELSDEEIDMLGALIAKFAKDNGYDK
ncbi:helix-turn-helix domain-containing protein [Lactococcus allomyrinae]|uniref:XRE family transcriptional regulator n=1 Tax=Lactococcus allomyrinae TaxID=2419773 RepID=A0A387BCN7_9LACT|nr:helix-turn-helix transcriptional regulator [Lactococcus allomyrinae]AYF99771.1 XRE family transcriptional regulator [Lactococcus allomyrinae]